MTTNRSDRDHSPRPETDAAQHDQSQRQRLYLCYSTPDNRTATTEAILRRFTRAATHPTYQAMLEVGRAQRTIFLCRYLRSRDEQREVNSGLNVMESWNGANAQIHYGKAADIASTAATNRKCRCCACISLRPRWCT